MQDKKFQKLTDLINKFVGQRKKPCLLLVLPEIRRHTVLEIHKKLKNFAYETLDIIIQTPGWDPDAAYMIVKTLRDCSKNINIFVPLYAKSAWTLVSLCANNLYLSKIWELGPLDTQVHEHDDGWESKYNSALNGFKALEQVKRNALETLDNATMLILQRAGLKLTETIKLAIQFTWSTSWKLYDQIDPKKIWEYARALDIWLNYWTKILIKYIWWQEEAANKTMRQLVFGYPSHWYVIDALELKELWLPVKDLEKDDDIVIENISEEMRNIDHKFAIIELFEYNKATSFTKESPITWKKTSKTIKLKKTK